MYHSKQPVDYSRFSFHTLLVRFVTMWTAVLDKAEWVSSGEVHVLHLAKYKSLTEKLGFVSTTSVAF